MSRSAQRLESLLSITAQIAMFHHLYRWQDKALPAHEIARHMAQLAKIASQLHKRYEAACSYEWANTEKYERRTENLEGKAREIADKLGVFLEHQRDPRGWPIILYFTPVGPDGTGRNADEIGRLY
jgi:hypothetical protein